MPYINMPSIINDNINDMNSPVIAVIHCFSKKKLFWSFQPYFQRKLKKYLLTRFEASGQDTKTWSITHLIQESLWSC